MGFSSLLRECARRGPRAYGSFSVRQAPRPVSFRLLLIWIDADARLGSNGITGAGSLLGGLTPGGATDPVSAVLEALPLILGGYDKTNTNPSGGLIGLVGAPGAGFVGGPLGILPGLP